MIAVLRGSKGLSDWRLLLRMLAALACGYSRAPKTLGSTLGSSPIFCQVWKVYCGAQLHVPADAATSCIANSGKCQLTLLTMIRGLAPMTRCAVCRLAGSRAAVVGVKTDILEFLYCPVLSAVLLIWCWWSSLVNGDVRSEYGVYHTKLLTSSPLLARVLLAPTTAMRCSYPLDEALLDRRTFHLVCANRGSAALTYTKPKAARAATSAEV